METYSQALEKLLEVNVLPHAKPEPWQSFREKYLWTLECNDILEVNQASLKKIFERYWTSVKKHLIFTDVVSICQVAEMGLTEVDYKFCFAMSKMAVTDEPTQYAKYSMLLWPEFLEFIGRLGDYKYRNTDDSDQPLAWKIEQVLEKLIPAFGLKKNDFNLNVEENSESDDDY